MYITIIMRNGFQFRYKDDLPPYVDRSSIYSCATEFIKVGGGMFRSLDISAITWGTDEEMPVMVIRP